VLADRPIVEPADVAKQVVRLIYLSLIPYPLNEGANVEGGDVRDGPSAPNRNEFATNIALDLTPLALARQFFPNEIFRDRQKRRLLFPKLRGALALLLLRRVDTPADKQAPLSGLLASLS
jgi:hypothetical protein